MGMNTLEGRQAYIDSQESDVEKTKAGHDFFTPEGKQRYINSQKSDLENTEAGFDLSAPEGRQKQINNQESDLEKAEKEALAGGATVELSSLEKNEEDPLTDLRELEYSKDSELKNITAEVEKARKAYAKKDYEITNIFTTYKVLTGRLNVDAEIIKEREYYYDQYKLALNNLLNYKIEKLKEENLPPNQLKKEMGDLAKYYNQDEKINLFESHTNARAEVWEQKFGKDAGWLAKTSGKFIKYTNEKINDYRKLNWKKKMAFGVGAGLVGAGFLVVGQRVLGGVAAGVGVTAGLEGKYRKKEGQKRKKEQEEILKNVENVENSEEKFEALMEKLQKEIDNFDKDLMNEKSEAKMRKIIGSAVGIFLSSGVVSQLIDFGMDKAGLSEVFGSIKESFFGKTPEVSATHSGNVPLTEEQIFGETNANVSPSDIHTEAGINPENIAQPNIELTIPEGSSFEGSIIKHLTENGMDKHQAGIEAHKMWSDFVKTHPDPTGHGYDIVHPNAHLEISPDVKSILNFEDSPKAEWPKMPETKINIEESVGVDGVPVSENINIPEVEKIITDAGISNEKTIEATAFTATAMAGGLGAKNVLQFNQIKKERAFNKLAKKYEFIKGEDFYSRSRKVLKNISGNDIKKWEIMKNITGNQLDKKEKILDAKLVKNIKDMEKKLMVFLGEGARIRKTETLRQWVARVMEYSIEEEKIEKKMAA